MIKWRERGGYGIERQFCLQFGLRNLLRLVIYRIPWSQLLDILPYWVSPCLGVVLQLALLSPPMQFPVSPLD